MKNNFFYMIILCAIFSSLRAHNEVICVFHNTTNSSLFYKTSQNADKAVHFSVKKTRKAGDHDFVELNAKESIKIAILRSSKINVCFDYGSYVFQPNSKKIIFYIKKDDVNNLNIDYSNKNSDCIIS